MELTCLAPKIIGLKFFNCSFFMRVFTVCPARPELYVKFQNLLLLIFFNQMPKVAYVPILKDVPQKYLELSPFFSLIRATQKFHLIFIFFLIVLNPSQKVHFLTIVT